MGSRVMSAEEAVHYIQAHRLFLHYADGDPGLDLWTPQRKLPLALRRSVYKHREQLLEWMRQGDYRLCPSPRLHRRAWRRSAGRPGVKVCFLCLQLDGGRVESEEERKTA